MINFIFIVCSNYYYNKFQVENVFVFKYNKNYHNLLLFEIKLRKKINVKPIISYILYEKKNKKVDIYSLKL